MVTARIEKWLSEVEPHSCHLDVRAYPIFYTYHALSWQLPVIESVTFWLLTDLSSLFAIWYWTWPNLPQDILNFFSIQYFIRSSSIRFSREQSLFQILDVFWCKCFFIMSTLMEPLLKMCHYDKIIYFSRENAYLHLEVLLIRWLYLVEK